MIAARVAALIGFVCLGASAGPGPGVAAPLARGDPAPAIALPDLHGVAFSSQARAGQVLVVTFGELYHDRTLRACGILKGALKDARLEGEPITPVLVVAQDVPREALLAQATDERLPATVLHDPGRMAYGAYRVAVMPTTIVIDKEGKVVHELDGLTARYADSLTDTLLLATGRMTPEKFDENLAGRETPGESEDVVQASRHANTARQLMQRGIPDLAAEEFTKALELDPGSVSARLGMGALMLRQGRLPEADAHFRQVLDADATSVEASLGLAQVQMLRGGSELNPAEELLRGVVARNPREPRAHYLLGRVLQLRDQHEDAAKEFRSASELLMSRRDNWDVVPVEDDHD